MAEYIDKALAQTELMMSAERYTIAHESNGFGTVEWSDNLIPVSRAMEIIRNMPSVEDVSVHKCKYVYRCSECGWHMLAYRDGLFNYCPNCGAKQSWVKNDTVYKR